MALKRVVGLGLSVVDEVYRVDSLDPASARTRYRSREVLSGGMMGNALSQVAALGQRPHLLSMIGNDREGRGLIRALRGRGVVTRGVVRSKEHPTTIAVVLVDRRSGERRFIVPDRRRLEASAPDFDLSAIGRRSLLLIDGHFPAQALRAAARARQVGAPVIGDFHTPGSVSRRLLPYVDHPIVPEEFCRSLGRGGPRGALRFLHRQYGGDPVVTLGSRGALALLDGQFVDIPARRVRVRDTTGAGDAFHGAFAAGLARGDCVREALQLASRAAAVCCTGNGATGRLLGADDPKG